MKVEVEFIEPEKDKSIKTFVKRRKARIILAPLCLLLGGISQAINLAGIVSTLLYIVGLALVINLGLEWRELKK
jgi:predicted exporter